MADSREFELLGLDEDGYRTFEEHEVRTAPLVSRDAVDLGEPFPQRALLGSVLSIHADSLPSRPNDRRVYMNLDAPSSGLVCGVQVGRTVRLFAACPTNARFSGLWEEPYRVVHFRIRIDYR